MADIFMSFFATEAATDPARVVTDFVIEEVPRKMLGSIPETERLSVACRTATQPASSWLPAHLPMTDWPGTRPYSSKVGPKLYEVQHQFGKCDLIALVVPIWD